MGDVYKARDTRLDRHVAIKTAKAEFSDRFQREARAVAALNHANICTLYDVGPDYLVMELVEGQTLSSLLRKGALPMEVVLRYAAQMADAIAAAHRKGIIHRDLKPENILVTRAGIKLLDFGLAKIADTEQDGCDPDQTAALNITAPNAIIGTPAYMAPEQLQAQACDARTDIFALGLVLFEMATGKRAFQGNSPSALAAAILYSEPAPIGNVPPGFAYLVERCVVKDPDDRWQSAADVYHFVSFLARPAGIAST
jgi:eukaryotic-like serine/threonine-protein kinase